MTKEELKEHRHRIAVLASKATMLELRAFSRHAVATVDLPHRLGALASQLPAGHPCTADVMIDQHTFLPYYAPFLTISAYTNARTWMTGSTEAGVRVRCGACTNRVRPPKFFRVCPECDRENREKYGEPYWRRLFQLPGVEVCPVHEVFLESSDIRFDPLPNRHKYFSAENARLVTKAHGVNPKKASHTILLDLARRFEWLLRQERLNPGLEFLHQRYESVLSERNFATRAGCIRMADVREEVVKFYGTELLQLLQSALPDDKRDGWLGHLLRKTSTAVAPLRHLLLLTALNIDLERFFTANSPEQAPQIAATPVGPWPCLNPICEHRSKPRQVTTTAIGRVLGKQSLFETALARLPLTRDVITHLIESGVDFAVRRVHAAAARLRRTQGSFQRWQLVRVAGLHYRLEHDPRVKQALDYEVRPSASVVFFSDGEQVPKSILQPSTRLPCDRPIAVVQG